MDEKKKKVLTAMVALLAALAETEGWMPRSMLYVAVGCDINVSELAIQIAQRAGYVEVTSVTVSITEEGRRKAREIEEAIAVAKATEEALA